MKLAYWCSEQCGALSLVNDQERLFVIAYYGNYDGFVVYRYGYEFDINFVVGRFKTLDNAVSVCNNLAQEAKYRILTEPEANLL